LKKNSKIFGGPWPLPAPSMLRHWP